MNAKTLPAHFDGERIRLDEPYEIEADAKLLVTVLPRQEGDLGEEDGWRTLSANGLELAYAEDEAEYSVDLIKEKNPEYEGK